METKLITALTELLTFMHCYGDPLTITTTGLSTPIQQLRAQADEIEAREKAIRQARTVLKEAVDKANKALPPSAVSSSS